MVGNVCWGLSAFFASFLWRVWCCGTRAEYNVVSFLLSVALHRPPDSSGVLPGCWASSHLHQAHLSLKIFELGGCALFLVLVRIQTAAIWVSSLCTIRLCWQACDDTVAEIHSTKNKRMDVFL